MERFKDWVEDLLPATAPKSARGQALAYTLNRWPKIVRFLEHPEMPPDNNYTEQQIEQFALGRKA